MKSQLPRILLYSSPPWLFRTTYIGYLYELTQVFPIIFLSEKLDIQSENIIKNKKIFPKLETIIPVNQYNENISLFAKHLKYSRFAKKLIEKFHPEVVIADSLSGPLEKYLFRYGHKSGAHTVAFQAGVQVTKLSDDLLWSSLQSDNKRIHQTFIKHFRELIDYWLFPLLMGTYPFFNKHLTQWEIGPARQEVESIVVFSDFEASLERERGRTEKEIKILPHPLTRETKKIFDLAFPSKKINSAKLSMTIMIDGNIIGHERNDLSPIPAEQYLRSRTLVLEYLSDNFPSYQIIIKPHPLIKNIEELKQLYKIKRSNVRFVDQREPADSFIQRSNIIVGFPPPSTTLYTTMLRYPNKIILYLDLHHELLGDAYRRYPDIEYIDSWNKFQTIVSKVKNKTYKKISSSVHKYKFKNAVEIINDLVS